MDGKFLGGSSYFITFIKEQYIKVKTFVLKYKNQVLNIFKYFHVSVEREK